MSCSVTYPPLVARRVVIGAMITLLRAAIPPMAPGSNNLIPAPPGRVFGVGLVAGQRSWRPRRDQRRSVDDGGTIDELHLQAPRRAEVGPSRSAHGASRWDRLDWTEHPNTLNGAEIRVGRVDVVDVDAHVVPADV